MVWNKDCVAESVEKLKRTYMDRIRNVMASVVLMCAAGAFMSAYAQEQPKLLQQTPPQPLQQTPDRTPPQAGSGYEIGGLVRDDLGPVIGATVVEVGTESVSATQIAVILIAAVVLLLQYVLLIGCLIATIVLACCHLHRIPLAQGEGGRHLWRSPFLILFFAVCAVWMILAVFI